jgi:hypothetical protein
LQCRFYYPLTAVSTAFDQFAFDVPTSGIAVDHIQSPPESLVGIVEALMKAVVKIATVDGVYF